MKKLSFIDKILFLLNSLLATFLLLSFLLPFISPLSHPIFAIFSLFAPILLIINVVFVIYWVLKLKKQFLLSSIILIIGWFFASPFYIFSKTINTISDKDNSLTLMSYNIRMFNHWKWIKNDSIPSKINEFISQQNPEILLVQEYYDLEEYQFKYPYQYVKTKNEKEKLGLAIFSNYPIINKGSFDFKKTSNNIIYADILKEEDTIRVYNLHLESLQIDTNKENFGQESSEKLISRLKNSFQKQAEQTITFLEHEENWKNKKIIAGDFNNTAYSWVYRQISENKKDAFLEAGSGFGKSYNYFLPMRIDFVLTDQNAIINNFETFDVKYSDHFPVMTKLNW